MILTAEKCATLEDLHHEPGKAELVGGRIVRYMPTGRRSSKVGKLILLLMTAFVDAYRRGETHGDNVGYAVPKLPSGRESFSPDVSYYDGPEQDDDMDFIQGPPTLAIEVRSKDGYGRAAERDMADKRADYFLAGTKVVWDVDVKAKCINAYSHRSPLLKKTYSIGQIAEAEAALPGWRVPVAAIFESL